MVYKRMINIFIDTCSRVPFKIRYIITIFLHITVISLWYFVTHPTFYSYSQLQQHEHEQLQNNYIRMKQSKAQYKVVSGQLERTIYNMTQNTIKRTYEQLLFGLLQAVTDHALIFVRYSYDTNIEREWYTKNQISLDVQGNMKHIVSFLHYMHEISELISCNSLSIVHSENQYELRVVMRLAQIKPLQLNKKS